MKPTPEKRTQRSGFTLIELLVVIAIIAVLASLTSAAVLRVLIKGPELKTRKDLSELQAALASFKSTFNIDNPPSRIKLCERYSQYNLSQQLDVDSVQFLKGMFPKILPLNLSDPVEASRYPWLGPVGINWNGNDRIDGPVILEGDQCLVFFLGGIPTTNPNGCNGFSTDPRNPATPGGDRIGPFFNFESSRLKMRSGQYFSYRDGFGKNFYAYFSSYKKANGYNRYYASLRVSDCNSLGVWPYAAALGRTPRYQNPETFQIISAGADGKFGRGTVITSAGNGIWMGRPLWDGSQIGAIDNGKDDMSNFHSLLLGTAAN